MRRIDHPGPAAAERHAAVLGEAVPVRFALEPDLTVDEAVAAGMRATGCRGGFVEFRGSRCEPFRYVMPAASSDPRYAAWYSETLEPDGMVDVMLACAIVGVREGKTFLHCHGIWDTTEGQRMGHMLAPLSRVAEPFEVVGVGFKDATFDAMPDAETNFTLFEPVRDTRASAAQTSARALLAKVRPNQDFSLAIEEICLRHGIASATVYGIGSLNGVRFVDGTRVDSPATEVQIREGHFGIEEGEGGKA